jgi:collagen type VI alpha
VGAITFSNEVVGQFYMNKYIGQAQALYNAFDFYDMFGTTNTPAALTDAQTQQFTMANGDRNGIPNYIVIVTDGYSNVNQQNTIPDAMALKNQGVIIYSIAVGASPQMSELVGMASTPSSQYVIPLPTIGNLTSTADTLLQRLCSPVASIAS